MSFTLDMSKWEQACPLDAYCRTMREHNLKVDAWREEYKAQLTSERRSQLDQVRDSLASMAASLSTVFRKRAYDRRDYPEISRIVGPVELTYVEQMRREFGMESGGLPTAAVDVFVWARGEPKHRWQTKIGGLPYRPRSQPWPQSAPDHQQPTHSMTFLGQICFSESRDLFPNLRGDVLLVFAEDEGFGRPEALAFEWHPLGLETLVEDQDVPVPAWQFACCHGFRHRTVDYQSIEATQGIDRLSESVLSLHGTKIGGFPICPVDDLFGTVSEVAQDELTFLCQINAIQPRNNQYYPWLNQREPVQVKDLTDPAQTLLIVDCGVLAFFLDGAGTIRWGVHTG